MSLIWLATARSGSESALKSPTATSNGLVPTVKRRRGAEAAAGAAEQDRDVVRRARVRDREVGVRVGVEVADREPERAVADGDGAGRARSSSPARRAGPRRRRPERLATARSGSASTLKSAVTIPNGPSPAG